MKKKDFTILIGLFLLLCPMAVSAQKAEYSDKYYLNTALKRQMDEGFEVVFLLGLNIGATTPVPIPDPLKIKSYTPSIRPKIGASFDYFFTENWGLGFGLTADWKGMIVDTELSGVHLSIHELLPLGIEFPLSGQVTGKNTTKVRTFYLSQSLHGIYRFNPRWQIKAGVYWAEALHRKFKGEVKNVMLLVEQPIQYEYDVHYGTFDYSSYVKKFDFGALIGGEFRLDNHFGFFADFSWGVLPFFKTTVPIEFKMYNIHLSLGITYRL